MIPDFPVKRPVIASIYEEGGKIALSPFSKFTDCP
jgi:hypothetical protein